MTEVLAGVGGASAVCLVVIVWLTYKLVRSKDEQLAARDMLDAERKELAKVRGELDVETAAHAVTQKRLSAEQELRASVEAQRNDAFRTARDHYAERLKNSGVADAIRIVDELLSGPLPGVVPDKVVPAGDPARSDDDLLDPGL